MSFFAALGPILSGVAGIAGALGGSGGSTQTSTVNYLKMRRAAEEAGFNPLTALRSGGAAGFQTVHTPALSSAETIARAIQGGVSGFMDTGVAAETREQESALLDAQLELIKAQTNRVRSGPDINMTGVRGSMAGGPQTPGSLSSQAAAATSGRETMPPRAPLAAPGYNVPNMSTRPNQDVIDQMLPAAYLPTSGGKGYMIEPGTASKESLEEISEGIALTEDAKHTFEYIKQNPGVAHDLTTGLQEAVGATIKHNRALWEQERKAKEKADFYRRLAPPEPRAEGFRQWQFDQGVRPSIYHRPEW